MLKQAKLEIEEQATMENIAKAIPLLTDFEKGYVLGLVDARRKEKEQEQTTDLFTSVV